MEIGDKIGDWEILSLTCDRKYYIKCRCRCGLEKEIYLYNLTNNKTDCCIKCSKVKNGTPNKGQYKYSFRVGETFGKWEVINNQSRRVGKRTQIECRCKCGKIQWIDHYALKNNKTLQCHNCMLIERNTTHGQSNTLLYWVWVNIKNRCLNPKYREYKYYGGRGINICDTWKDDFQSFYNWSITNGYKEGLTIDRKDTNGNYEPSNCRWITQAQNNYNTRPKSVKQKTSKYKGVYYRSSQPLKPWRTEIRKGVDRYFLGSFETEEEAALAYNQKAIELFGEHAYLNEV